MNNCNFAMPHAVEKHSHFIIELIGALEMVEESAMPEIHARASALLTQEKAKRIKTLPLFKSVDQALTTIYQVRAASSVKTATYGIKSASSTAPDKISAVERAAEAQWVFTVVDETLGEIERAVVTCKYDGLGKDREGAINVLTKANRDIAQNGDLVRALLIREFEFGEAYARSLPAIALETDSALRTVERVAQKVRRRIAGISLDIEKSLRIAFEARGWLASATANRRFNA